MPEDEPAEAAAPEPAAPAPAAAPKRRPAPRPQKKSGAGRAIAWAAMLVVVVALGAGAYFGRNQIVAQFPQFEPVYTVLGIPVVRPGPTLEISLAAPEDTLRDGDRVVLLRGTVKNISNRKQRVPRLRARLTGQDDAVLLEWEFEAPKAELDAGATVDFTTEAVNPPQEGRNLTINFVQMPEESS